MDKPVNRARAKPEADSAAVPSVLTPSRPSSPSSVADEDPFDRVTHARIAQLCGGFSPMGVAEAAFDWGLHLAEGSNQDGRAESLIHSIKGRKYHAVYRAREGRAVAAQPRTA